ncbi:MAG: hypothetical protein HOP14_01235 [Acidobacteria bacterium]|nr:hypothetical protein [Acidobacteriota bacterium]
MPDARKPPTAEPRRSAADHAVADPGKAVADPGKKGPAEVVEIRVRRGASRRYALLKEKSEGLPVVVAWDRRETDRRASDTTFRGDRRNTDRRGEPAFTWEMADFVVVGKAPDGDDAA